MLPWRYWEIIDTQLVHVLWILKFADDTKISCELSQVKDCDKLQKDLELLHRLSSAI